jgi:uncharacterized coiled-coil protein SlyX
MSKVLLTLSLLLALPAASEKIKPLKPEETRVIIEHLEDMVEEQQQRLSIHKMEIDKLRATVSALESRLSSIEKSTAIVEKR